MSEKVLGVPKDVAKFKANGYWAGDGGGCCILWTERSVFNVRLSFPELAMIKFSVTFDKGEIKRKSLNDLVLHSLEIHITYLIVAAHE